MNFCTADKLPLFEAAAAAEAVEADDEVAAVDVVTPLGGVELVVVVWLMDISAKRKKVGK